MLVQPCEYAKTTDLYTRKGDFYCMWIIAQKKKKIYQGGFYLNSNFRAPNTESIQKLWNGVPKYILRVLFPGASSFENPCPQVNE